MSITIIFDIYYTNLKCYLHLLYKMIGRRNKKQEWMNLISQLNVLVNSLLFVESSERYQDVIYPICLSVHIIHKTRTKCNQRPI